MKGPVADGHTTTSLIRGLVTSHTNLINSAPASDQDGRGKKSRESLITNRDPVYYLILDGCSCTDEMRGNGSAELQ